MQRIERYGVIALVFLLVTIVAVSLWGERKKSDGWFSFLERDSKASRIEELLAEAERPTVVEPGERAPSRELTDGRVPLSDPDSGPLSGPAYRGPETPQAYFDEYGSTVQPETLTGDLVYAPPTVAVPEPAAESNLVPAAKPAAAREYTIRAGDTLSEIAMRELGTKDRWRELAELNPGLDPARLNVGTRIRLSGAASPAKVSGAGAPALARSSEAAQPAAKPAAGGSYTIRAGDTLSEIAMRELGTTARWRELVELNPGLDPARLHVGTRIRLPAAAAAAPAQPREPRETRVASAVTPSAAATTRSKVR